MPLIHSKASLLLVFFSLLLITSCEDDHNIFGACEVKLSDPDPDFGTQYVCLDDSQKSLCDDKNSGTFQSVFYEDVSCSSLGYFFEKNGQYYASSTNFSTPGSGGAWAGSGGTGGTGSYDYTFTCAWDGSEHTVPIPEDGCETENEYYARTFTCNEVGNMYDACRDYFGCNGQTDISFCDQYK